MKDNADERAFRGSSDEWSPLREAIVGTAMGARTPTIGPDQIAIEGVQPGSPYSGLPYDDRVIHETEEDLSLLVEILQDLGVVVHRPDSVDHSAVYSSPSWSTSGFYSYCPRDTVLVVGNTLVEAPMALRSRQYEALALRRTLTDLGDRGAKWIAAPRPALDLCTYAPAGSSGSVLSEAEPIFDAANVIRLGQDLLYLHSDTGNLRGARWLQTVLGSEYRVHVCRDLYRGVHLDSTLMPLRPGLVLCNPSRVTDKNMPEPLRDWEALWCPVMNEESSPGRPPLSSAWVGMNILMVNPGLALVEARQEALMRVLQTRGIDSVPVRLRHGRALGGGLHCVVLDLVRSE